MFNTVGEYLSNFGSTLDIIGPENYKAAMESISGYLERAYNIRLVEILYPTTIRGESEALLKPAWPENTQDYPLKRDGEDSMANGQIAHCFLSRISAWIIQQEGGSLSEGNCVNTWNEGSKADFPIAYIQNQQIHFDSKTSIIIPVSTLDTGAREELSNYVVNYESDICLYSSRTHKKELEDIALAIAKLTFLKENREWQKQQTTESINNLRHICETNRGLTNEERQIFIACSSRASNDVLGSLRSILDEFSKNLPPLKVIYWNDLSETGMVTEAVESAIAQCRYGVAYLSETAPEENNHKFIDNPNVLYEAGIMQGLKLVDPSGNRHWFAIRETDSPAIPFDIASERRLEVPRLADGNLNESQFKDDLKKMVTKMISVDETL